MLEKKILHLIDMTKAIVDRSNRDLTYTWSYQEHSNHELCEIVISIVQSVLIIPPLTLS